MLSLTDNHFHSKIGILEFQCSRHNYETIVWRTCVNNTTFTRLEIASKEQAFLYYICIWFSILRTDF